MSATRTAPKSRVTDARDPEKWDRNWLPPMSVARKSFAAVAWKGEIIVLGGGWKSMESIRFPRRTEECRVSSWKQLPQNGKALSHCGAGVVSGVRGIHSNALLVVTGGGSGSLHRDKKKLDSTLDIFDLETSKWISLKTVRMERHQCAVASSPSGADVVYCVGGRRADGTFLKSVETFCPRRNSWSVLPGEMKVARARCAAVVVNGGKTLVVMGGIVSNSSTTSVVECFCRTEGQWSELPSLKTGRSDCAAVAVGNDIYVMGGRSSKNTALATVERFDWQRQCWEILPHPMTTPRSGCCAVEVGGHIVVLGGHSNLDHLRSAEVLKLPPLAPTFRVELPELSLPPRFDSEAWKGWCMDTTELLTDTTARLEDAMARIANLRDATVDTAKREWEARVQATVARCEAEVQAATIQYKEKVEEAEADAQEQSALLAEKGHEWMRRLEEHTLGLQQQQPEKKIEAFPELLCPLTHEVMVDPVFCADGQAYERSAILAWFTLSGATRNPTSPVTNLPLESRTLTRALALKSLCDRFREESGE